MRQGAFGIAQGADGIGHDVTSLSTCTWNRSRHSPPTSWSSKELISMIRRRSPINGLRHHHTSNNCKSFGFRSRFWRAALPFPATKIGIWHQVHWGQLQTSDNDITLLWEGSAEQTMGGGRKITLVKNEPSSEDFIRICRTSC